MKPQLKPDITPERYYPLVVRAVSKLVNSLNYGDQIDSNLFDDLVQEGRLALERSIKSFDRDGKVKFTTYAWHAIHNAALSYLYKFRLNISLPSNGWQCDPKSECGQLIEKIIESEWLPVEAMDHIADSTYDKVEAKLLFCHIKASLETMEPIRARCVELYLQGKSRADISRTLSGAISPTHIGRVLKTAAAELLEIKV